MDFIRNRPERVEILTNYAKHASGVMILNNTNIINGRTDSWFKFWDPSFKNWQESRPSALFTNKGADPDKPGYYFIYINLKPSHPEYGYLIVVSKMNSSCVDRSMYLETTGLEQFNPDNNLPKRRPVIKKKSYQFTQK